MCLCPVNCAFPHCHLPYIIAFAITYPPAAACLLGATPPCFHLLPQCHTHLPACVQADTCPTARLTQCPGTDTPHPHFITVTNCLCLPPPRRAPPLLVRGFPFPSALPRSVLPACLLPRLICQLPTLLLRWFILPVLLLFSATREPALRLCPATLPATCGRDTFPFRAVRTFATAHRFYPLPLPADCNCVSTRY